MKDNIVNIEKFKNKTKKESSFQLEAARQMVSSDKKLLAITEALGLTLDEAADQLLQVSALHNQVEFMIHQYNEKNQFSPIFTSMIVQLLSTECSDQLTLLAMHPAINESTFQRFKGHAIAPILDVKHSSENTSEDFDAFDTGEEDDKQ